MKILLGGTLPFLLFILVHLIIWRFKVPQNPKNVLLKLFLGGYILVSLALICTPESSGITSIFPENLVETVHAGVLYATLALTYIIFYQGLMTNSPSLVLVTKVFETGRKGIAMDQFYQYFSDDTLIKPRLDFMLEQRLAYLDKDTFHLSPSGLFYAKLFISYRNLLKIGPSSSG
jgi:hypothetical protein